MATNNQEDHALESLEARLTAWFSRAQLCSFEALARARGLSRSEVLRRAATLGLQLLEGGAAVCVQTDADGPSRAAEGERQQPPPIAAGVVGGAVEDDPIAKEWRRLAELRQEDPIFALIEETRASEPAPDQELLIQSQIKPRRARAFDPAAEQQRRGEGIVVTPAEVIALWNEHRKQIAARWEIVNIGAGLNGYRRTPRPAIFGEALRRRIVHASRRLPTIEAWTAALEALAEVPPHAVNRLFLWELDRLCRVPLEEHEQEPLRLLPPEDRPVFAERLSAYSTWTAPRSATTSAPPSSTTSAPPSSTTSAPPSSTTSAKRAPVSRGGVSSNARGSYTMRFPTITLSDEERAVMLHKLAEEQQRAREQRAREQRAREAAEREAEREAARKLEECQRAATTGLEKLRALRAALGAKR